MTDAATARIWEARPGINGAWSVGHELRGIGWCEISGPHTRKEAHVIAAAPDMLNMLKCIYNPQAPIGGDALMSNLRKVIAKAEGRNAS